MRIYNTLSRQKEPFKPLNEGQVLMYVCGPNLYGPCHVGHAMSYVVFDVVRRYLEYRGYSVRHVQNFTDLEDRIIETAQAQHTSVQELAEVYVVRFLIEMRDLNIERAHEYPRATEVIPKIIEIIQGLVTKGYAYTVDGDVYYHVASNPDYGKLSRRTLEGMEAGARIEVDERKEHPMDFALWKNAKPGEPSWQSPWGLGRPGWHIECSAMAIEFLGQQIDIHGGGQDVLFPHHENEIAQTESYTGRIPFVKYWIHNGLLRPREGQEKMTRHLSNFVSLQEALQRYNPDAIRLFLISSHYRSPLVWSDEGVLAVERGLGRLREALTLRGLGAKTKGQEETGTLTQFAERTREAFIEAMDDDFNTPVAISHLFDLAREINRAKQEIHAAALAPAQGILRTLANALGLTLQETRPRDAVDAAPFIELLASIRSDLRANKQWKLADMIRSQLSKLGVTLEDGSEGTTWRLSKE
ncbi:MAG: cysteine--tRNA ligase [Bacteroidota bacterium]